MSPKTRGKNHKTLGTPEIKAMNNLKTREKNQETTTLR